MVSHDRWLLDTVCERTWEVDRGQVHSAEGGYSAYVLAQAERERSEEVAERRRRNLARKELAWLQRGARARTTKAKFRVEAANALIAAEPPPRDSVELTRLATARLGKTVIDLEDVTVSAGDRPLLNRVTWRLGPGDRVGIVGVNRSIGSFSISRVRYCTNEYRSNLGCACARKRGETSVKTYSVQFSGKTGRMKLVVPPVPPPTSRIRKAFPGGTLAIISRDGFLRQQIAEAKGRRIRQKDLPVNSPSGNRRFSGSTSPLSTAGRCSPQIRDTIASIWLSGNCSQSVFQSCCGSALALSSCAVNSFAISRSQR